MGLAQCFRAFSLLLKIPHNVLRYAVPAEPKSCRVVSISSCGFSISLADSRRVKISHEVRSKPESRRVGGFPYANTPCYSLFFVM